MNQRNVVLTGLPRSGTTLSCYLLNMLPDTVALSEPYAPKMSDKQRGAEVLCAGLDRVFRRMRRMIQTEKAAMSKQIEGRVPDNPFGRERGDTGLRKQLATKGKITIEKNLSRNFLLVIKAPGLFTALLPSLVERFAVYAVIRNPLAVLASWNTLEGPARNVNFPLAEMYDEELARQLATESDDIGRQLCLLSWFCERFRRHLPEGNIVYYESIVESGGKALVAITPAAAHLDEPLTSRNLNELYGPQKMQILGERLLASDGAYWHYYNKESVEELLSRVT